MERAAAAADASVFAIVIGGEVDQLVHEALTEAFLLSETGLTAGHQREVGVHAGVPAAESLDTMTGIVVADIIALAGRADEGAGTASEAGFREACPLFGVEGLEQDIAAEFFGREVSKREFAEYFAGSGF